uniref:RING-type E3 ubiquitin transferase n=1 Tax=Salix viminalis TaxID=40686 RepID=A0A6N2LZ22_SALVM
MNKVESGAGLMAMHERELALMQRQRGAFHSLSETIDFDQGSVSNSTVMSQQTSFSNMLNPVDSRLSNNAVSSSNLSCSNATTHDVQSFSGWNSGESSSRLSLQNQVNDDGIKMEEWLSTSVNAHPTVGQRSEERLFETTNNILFPGRVSMAISGNQVRSGPLFLQGSSSNHIPLSVNPNAGHIGEIINGRPSTGSVSGLNQLNPGGLEIERASSSGVSSDDVGTSSGSSGYIVEETNGGSGSSLGVWGLSCKRKALEGTTGQSFPGGSSSCFPQAESSAWHNEPNNHSVSSSLSLSTPLLNTPTLNTPSVTPPEQLNPRFGYGMRGAPPDAFPSSNVSRIADPLRNFGRRISPGHQQESVTFNLSTTGGSRRWSLQHSPRPVTVSDYLESRSTEPANSSAIQGQLHAINPSLSRSLLRWHDFSSSRVGNSSSSLIPGELGASSREEANLRSFQRNNADHPMFAPGTEMRSMAQDPTRWGLATENMSTSDSFSSTRIGPSSSVHPFPTPGWIHHSPTTHNQQRISEFSTWSLFPPMASESGGHSCHFSPLSIDPSSSAQDTQISSGSSSQGHNSTFPRSALLMEEQSDDGALAADIEGRHRLISEIRHVLNAMRRGENLRVEDYMLFDPFYHGMAEMHDRHRDMRLDVDNMSYEELLALEERIGDVSTGLTEETILKLLKQERHMPINTESPADLEPCCICQEEYAAGDDMGIIDCGHDFHTDCIKRWLMQKNLCPIWMSGGGQGSGGEEKSGKNIRLPGSSSKIGIKKQENKAKKRGQMCKSNGKGSAGESDQEITHIWTERERRKKMRTMFSNLHALLPQLPPKADKSTIVDEALQKEKQESLQGAMTFGYEPSLIAPQKQADSREAFLADQVSSSNLAISAAQSLPSASRYDPVHFQTWTSSNVVLNICGDEAQISVCSPKKPGLFATICYVLEKHNVEVLSAHVSSDSNRSMHMIQAHASAGASDQFGQTFPVEEVFKQVACEIMCRVSS